MKDRLRRERLQEFDAVAPDDQAKLLLRGRQRVHHRRRWWVFTYDPAGRPVRLVLAWTNLIQDELRTLTAYTVAGVIVHIAGGLASLIGAQFATRHQWPLLGYFLLGVTLALLGSVFVGFPTLLFRTAYRIARGPAPLVLG